MTVAVCARCAGWCAAGVALCDYCAKDEAKPSGWAEDNKRACDFFHRGIEPPNRPTPGEWLRVPLLGDD